MRNDGRHRMADDSTTTAQPYIFTAAARIKRHEDFAVEMGLRALIDHADRPDFAREVALCFLSTGMDCIADINAESIGGRAA